MVDIQLDVKVDQFNEAMNQMARVLQGSATKRDIIRSEVRSILQKTVDEVKVSTENKIRLSVSTREWTTLNGQRLRIAGIGPTTKNGKTRDHRNKYPSAIWSSIQAQTQESIRKKIAAIGWGQRAWAELARSIGLTINAGRGNTAEIAGKDASTYVSSTQETTADSYTLSVRNAQNLQNWIGGRTAFFSAIAGRVGFFRQNLKHGVFQDLKTVAAKYPGIRVDSD